ncbi:MAG: enoyl-CoA hydratase/isomerase family protein [Novosphingobium sp.]|nr:enoyl-CoA hydratase/isomerase family protein [Novosphingobium sp.]
MSDILQFSDLTPFGWSRSAAPALLVALNGPSDGGLRWDLPHCPVIGVGDPDLPLASHVDVVVADADEGRALVARCLRWPRAAGVLVQLMRAIQDMPVGQALVAESMAYGLLQGGAEHRAWRAARNQSEAGLLSPEGRLHLQRSGNRLLIEIDRTEAHNAIDRALRDALREAFELAALDQDIVEISLSARGRTFSTGADLREFGTTTDPAQAHDIRMRTLPAHAIAVCADRLRVRIEGACIGSGLEMAAFATHIVSSRKAWFQLPELAMGLIPGAGGCVSLSRRIGRQRAAHLVLSGKRIGAQQALAWGLVDELI